MQRRVFPFSDDVEVAFDSEIGNGFCDWFQDEFGELLDVFGEADADGTVESYVVLHEPEEGLRGDLMTV